MPARMRDDTSMRTNAAIGNRQIRSLALAKKSRAQMNEMTATTSFALIRACSSV